MAELADTIQHEFERLMAERTAALAEAERIDRALRDCRAAARLFGVDLPEAGRKTRITIAALVANAVSDAGSGGITVKDMRPVIEAFYGAEFHPKSIGVSLQRMAKDGTAKCVGHRWFAQSERTEA
jgi:DNA-binding transcriptional regulator YdaS (Cro superfamily)